MSWVRNDLDGILDACAECGAHAGWRPNGERDKWAAACTDCTEQTAFVASKFDAAVEWNRTQRAKAGERSGGGG